MYSQNHVHHQCKQPPSKQSANLSCGLEVRSSLQETPPFIPGICMLHTPNFSHVHHWTENLSRTSHPGADRICKLQNILTKTGISLKIHENLLISFSYLLISTHIYSRMKKKSSRSQQTSAAGSLFQQLFTRDGPRGSQEDRSTKFVLGFHRDTK